MTAPRQAPGASGASVVVVLGATALVVVGLWAARKDDPPPSTPVEQWVTATPLAPPAPPPPPAARPEPTTEPLVREPTEVLGQGGTSTLDRDLGRVCVKDAQGQVVYEATLGDLVKDLARVNHPDRSHPAPSVDLRDGRRVVLSDEVYVQLPLERRYSRVTAPPEQLAPPGFQPPAEPVRRR